MLEGAEAGHGVEGAEALAVQPPRVVEMHVEVVASARRVLRLGQGDAEAAGAAGADEVQQRPPAASEVEHPPIGTDPDLLGDVLVLARLRLLEAQREVAVVLGAAEVRELAHAQAKDAVGQRVGEVDVVAVGHGVRPAG